MYLMPLLLCLYRWPRWNKKLIRQVRGGVDWMLPRGPINPNYSVIL